ncbi:GH13 alpha-amylase precursor [Tricholoma matsutake]|nr:GH13 alpha-amylase precursor [Tricholoma matsutake 945]
MLKFQFILPTLIAAIASVVLTATPDQWRSKSIYQVMTDRFAVADNSSKPCDTSARKYCGGSWKGITSHLDYIQNLGFDAIWISPVVENLEGETGYGEAYHGYWTKNINKINTHYGSEGDLMELSNALHSRNMFLMVDIVVNHFAVIPPNSTSSKLDFSNLSPFPSESDYHTRCEIRDYMNQTEVEQCWLGDNILPLADLNTEDPSIVQALNSWISELVKKYDMDGLRLDTAKHIRKDFWPSFTQSAAIFTIGEVVSDQTNYTKAYTYCLDSILDYPGWFSLKSAFSNPAGNLSALVDTVTKTQTIYKNGAFMTGSFLENHDQPRFQSLTQDQALVKNAMMWPFINDGIPILYYGQEQGYTGAEDPQNREALWPTAYGTQNVLTKHVISLNAARKAAAAWNPNFLSTSLKFIAQPNQGTLVVSKPPLLALLTNVGNKSTTTTSWTIPGSEGLYMSGEDIVNVLDCKVYQADKEGGISVQVDSGMPQLLMPASSLNQHGILCSSVATGTGNSKIVSSTVTQTSHVGWSVVCGTFLAFWSVLFLL